MNSFSIPQKYNSTNKILNQEKVLTIYSYNYLTLHKIYAIRKYDI